MIRSIESFTTPRFWALYERLPPEVRQQAREAADPSHPSLQFKKVHPSQQVYSARVNLDYRAVCTFEKSAALRFWIGPHDEYDQLLRGARHNPHNESVCQEGL